MILVIALAQLVDLVTWVPAISRVPSGELGLAQFATVERMVVAKLVGIAALSIIVLVIPRLPRVPVAKRLRWERRAVLFIGFAGVIGAATNIVFGGLL